MISVLEQYNNYDCIDLVLAELKINPTFLVLSGITQKEYFLKIDQNSVFIKYHHADKLAGFISFYCNNYETKEAFITLVLVDIEFRGLKIGKKMFGDLFEFIKNKNFEKCSLEVRQNNVSALKLYESLGFEQSLKMDDSVIMTMKV
ncbi:hypothetical protein B9T27_02940 [Acinetobacter sp. ANC 4648]|nr:hypothetical protein B9T27_02940 [Acinetobacter sp. ANC 4648]